MDESDGGKKENVIAAALRQADAADPRSSWWATGVTTLAGALNRIPAIGVLYGYGSREELEEAGADLYGRLRCRAWKLC